MHVALVHLTTKQPIQYPSACGKYNLKTKFFFFSFLSSFLLCFIQVRVTGCTHLIIIIIIMMQEIFSLNSNTDSQGFTV